MAHVIKKNKRIIGVELFCGCGGLTKGLVDVGIQMVKGVDIDQTAKETYEKNNPGSKFMEADIRDLSVKDLMSGINRKDTELLLAGCAPCQPFSYHVADSKHDSRRSLMQCFAHIIEKIRPDHILVENVPRFQSHTNVYHTRFLQMLEKLGYYYDEAILNAVNYGVPQSRRRYVLLGSRSPVKIPKETHGKGKHGFKTVKDAIKKYPKIGAGHISDIIPNHVARDLSEINLRRIKLTPKNGGSRNDIPERMKLKCHRNHEGHSDVYGRMSWDKPAPTLTCKCTSLSNGRFGHPTQSRAITVREAAALQTFPDNYVFYSSNTRNAIHIGNAVPVLLARKLGKVFTKTR